MPTANIIPKFDDSGDSGDIANSENQTLVPNNIVTIILMTKDILAQWISLLSTVITFCSNGKTITPKMVSDYVQQKSTGENLSLMKKIFVFSINIETYKNQLYNYINMFPLSIDNVKALITVVETKFDIQSGVLSVSTDVTDNIEYVADYVTEYTREEFLLALSETSKYYIFKKLLVIKSVEDLVIVFNDTVRESNNANT